MSDVVFLAFSALARFWKEADALLKELASQLENPNEVIVLGKMTDCDFSDEDGYGYYYEYKASIKKNRKPIKRPITFHFDCARALSEGSKSSWPHAKHSCLVVGYSPLKDQPWEAEWLRVSAIGSLLDTETWNECKKNQYAGGRLLEWAKYRKSDAWFDKAWTYAVPLSKISTPNDISSNLTQPIMSLLIENDTKALQGSAAIVWPS
jgi:hypothetical protein